MGESWSLNLRWSMGSSALGMKLFIPYWWCNKGDLGRIQNDCTVLKSEKHRYLMVRVKGFKYRWPTDKRCSTSLEKWKIRTGLPWWFSGKESACQCKRCEFYPSLHTGQMVIIKKSTNNKCWRGCGEKGNLLHVGGNVNWYCGEQYGGSLRN